MPRSGGAQNLRLGDRVRVVGTHTDEARYLLNGLEGKVTAILPHGVVVVLDSDPAILQRVIGTAGTVGNVSKPQRLLGYSEVDKISE